MRIEVYTSRPLAECFYFLREGQPNAPDHFKSLEKVHVVAEEILDDGKSGRWWFVAAQGPHASLPDGFFHDWFPPHTVVDATSIMPGEPSAPFKGWVKREVRPPEIEELTRLRRQRLDRLAAEVRHTMYCRQVVEDRAKLVEQAATIAKLKSQLSEADGRCREFGERAATLTAELAQVRAELQAKSLLHRFGEWMRGK